MYSLFRDATATRTPAGEPETAVRASARARTVAGWLRGSRSGMFFCAVVVGVGAGFGAVAFRYLIFGLTWLATGSTQFGQLGRVASGHVPWLGVWFFVLVPVVGGLVYGPLIYRFAPEARGHGVPEVMIAVAENGGRIRPQVSVVKALASALCIGVGGSVGREGPIVQIGSALASGLGQWVRMPENRLRILVACGAAGGISATFNAPLTGVFFGVELILREVSAEAVFTVMLSSMLANVIGRAFFGAAPFFEHLPSGIELHTSADYLLVAGLAVVAALIGLAFKTVLYAVEDGCDRVWGNRPEWARPAVGGLVLGLLLLAIPQLYGVGYPVLYKAFDGGYAIWFLLLLCVGKMVAAGLTIGIGGSGGVFAPSLFVGATSGMAFGEIAAHVFGPAAGQPALYAVVGMAAVFASAARGPLTSVASVVEMTGDFGLLLPVMLAVAIATTTSRALSYGTIYTTKLLRRGTDIDRPDTGHTFTVLTVADAMVPFASPLSLAGAAPGTDPTRKTGPAGDVGQQLGELTRIRHPQALFANESLAQALRQLVLYGRDGLPVVSIEGNELRGWITNQHVLRAVSHQLATSAPEPTAGHRPAGGAGQDTVEDSADEHDPRSELSGFHIAEYTVSQASAGRKLGEVSWPAGQLPVSVLHNRRLCEPDPATRLRAGDRVNVLVPAPLEDPNGSTPSKPATRDGRGASAPPDGHDESLPEPVGG
jgi:CIC family chloride channel protein